MNVIVSASNSVVISVSVIVSVSVYFIRVLDIYASEALITTEAP